MAGTKHSYGLGANDNPLHTQVAIIKDYCINTGNKVSQKFVTDKWGFTRLSAIIYILKDELEAEGGVYKVCDERVSCTNRFGNKTYYKNYWIESTTE